MNYGQDITRVLCEAGDDGLPVKKIVRHIYNEYNGLFNTTSYEDVYKRVMAFVQKNSKAKNSILEKTGKWGHYRINKASNKASQLMLEFDNDNAVQQEAEKTAERDNSLSLF